MDVAVGRRRVEGKQKEKTMKFVGKKKEDEEVVGEAKLSFGRERRRNGHMYSESQER